MCAAVIVPDPGHVALKASKALAIAPSVKLCPHPAGSRRSDQITSVNMPAKAVSDGYHKFCFRLWRPRLVPASEVTSHAYLTSIIHGRRLGHCCSLRRDPRAASSRFRSPSRSSFEAAARRASLGSSPPSLAHRPLFVSLVLTSSSNVPIGQKHATMEKLLRGLTGCPPSHEGHLLGQNSAVTLCMQVDNIVFCAVACALQPSMPPANTERNVKKRCKFGPRAPAQEGPIGSTGSTRGSSGSQEKRGQRLPNFARVLLHDFLQIHNSSTQPQTRRL
jgi:hypothetical protein